MSTLEIRPSNTRTIVLLVLLGLPFIAGGLALIALAVADRRVWMLLPGILGVGLGGFGFAMIPALIRRPVSARLTPTDLWLHVAGVAGSVPWEDVEMVGHAQMGRQQFAGIRLARVDRYLASIDPGSLRRPRRILWALRAGRAGAEQAGARSGSLGALGPLRGIGDMLAANERLTGYHLLLGWADRDRPADATVEMIRRHRKAQRAAT